MPAATPCVQRVVHSFYSFLSRKAGGLGLWLNVTRPLFYPECNWLDLWVCQFTYVVWHCIIPDIIDDVTTSCLGAQLWSTTRTTDMSPQSNRESEMNASLLRHHLLLPNTISSCWRKTWLRNVQQEIKLEAWQKESDTAFFQLWTLHESMDIKEYKTQVSPFCYGWICWLFCPFLQNSKM